MERSAPPIDDDPIDPDEIFALLSEYEQVRRKYTREIPARMVAVRARIQDLMGRWLDDPRQVDVDELLACEGALMAHRRWWLEHRGEDPLAGPRAQHLTLFRRMRAHLARIEPAEKPPSRPNGQTGRQTPENVANSGPTCLTASDMSHGTRLRNGGPIPQDAGRMPTNAQTILSRGQMTACNITLLRERYELSKNRLAKEAGVLRSSLFDWETAINEPTERNLQKLLDALNEYAPAGEHHQIWFFWTMHNDPRAQELYTQMAAKKAA